MGGVEAALAEHAFEHLFIECLGWDRVQAKVSIPLSESEFELTAIAQKRGFTVFLSAAHRTVLANRSLLREVQRKLRRTYHEHILIHCCETPRKQVWQWATKSSDGHRVLHREHPFFSNEPPPRLLDRLEGLAVSLDDEDQTSLVDVLDRVRTALLPDSELNLFAKKPGYAAKSDRLAMAMKRGEPGAFGAFVEFHMPLARHSSKVLVRWFGMDRDDAEQTAMIGLIEAARRYDPDRGFQFSTYAGYWIRSACQRYGLNWGLQIRVPSHIFWPCYRLMFTRNRLIAAHGQRKGETRFKQELAAAGISDENWQNFCVARSVDCLSELDRQTRATLDVPEKPDVGLDPVVTDLREQIRGSFSCLTARQARIIRLRYGIEEREHTLQEVGELLGITRERVRQIQVKAEGRLERAMIRMNLVEAPVVEEDNEEVRDEADTTDEVSAEEVTT
jgi:RNA polymerase sigma factor (sigma-70 family)